MLIDYSYRPPSEFDQQMFKRLVPADHYLRRVKALIDFERFRPELAACYSPDQGRPADDPVLMLKLEYLQFQYNLSDREVISETQVNVAFRFLLDLASDSALPDPSLLTIFRQRLGEQTHQKVFDGLITQARALGLVKARLRLKDATHVIANIAVPSTIRLVATARHHLLQAARPFDPDRVGVEEQRALELRAATADLSDEERLWQRVNHLRALLPWAASLRLELAASPRGSLRQRQRLAQAWAVAHKVVQDRDHPEGGDRLRSVQDPEARRGKHGRFFDGYLLDVAVDADSELITALNLLPANADEAADASTLIRQEEQAQCYDIAALSLDGIGFRGDLLREWQDPAGLHLQVVVPPTPEPAPSGLFRPRDFELAASGTSVGCPGGAQTARRYRNAHNTGWTYVFAQATCAACPWQSHCIPRLPQHTGRRVIKNDYEAEYQAARQKAHTAEYAEVRREHPTVERKIAELMQQHGGRRARYWGRLRNKIQYLLTGLAVNIKRIVRYLSGCARLQRRTQMI